MKIFINRIALARDELTLNEFKGCLDRLIASGFWLSIDLYNKALEEAQSIAKRVALLHGHEEELLKALVNSEGFDVVVHGHTHKAEVYRKGETLVVNPGEVCGYLSGKSTIALFDTVRRECLDPSIYRLN